MAMGTQNNPPDRTPIIQVRGLCNRFGTHSVHEDLDLDLYPGEILGVVGGSGTGKSVLLRSIVGLIIFSAGHITVFGQDLTELSAPERSLYEQRFGVLFQGGALFTSLNLEQNIALPLIEHAGLKRAEAEELARSEEHTSELQSRPHLVCRLL